MSEGKKALIGIVAALPAVFSGIEVYENTGSVAAGLMAWLVVGLSIIIVGVTLSER